MPFFQQRVGIMMFWKMVGGVSYLCEVIGYIMSCSVLFSGGVGDGAVGRERGGGDGEEKKKKRMRLGQGKKTTRNIWGREFDIENAPTPATDLEIVISTIIFFLLPHICVFFAQSEHY